MCSTIILLGDLQNDVGIYRNRSYSYYQADIHSLKTLYQLWILNSKVPRHAVLNVILQWYLVKYISKSENSFLATNKILRTLSHQILTPVLLPSNNTCLLNCSISYTTRGITLVSFKILFLCACESDFESNLFWFSFRKHTVKEEINQQLQIRLNIREIK